MRAAVIGASGHTGTFVVAELLRRGHAPVAVYRDASKALSASSDATEMRVASIDDPASLDAALARTDVVINCAGPFLDTAAAVVDAALRAEIHYLDVTAEQESVRATFRSFDAIARDRHVAIVPAAGFFGAAGDLAATAAMGDWTRADRIDVAIALDRWHPTAGTRNTGDRNTFARVVIRQGKLAVHDAREEARTWTFAEPFGEQVVAEVPLSETILIAHHLEVAEMHNYLNERSLGDLSDPATPPPVAADERGRSAQVFVIETIVAAGARRRFARVRGRDIYASTAPLVVEAAERVCGGESPDGVHSAGEVFDAVAFFHALEKRGELTFERGDA